MTTITDDFESYPVGQNLDDSPDWWVQYVAGSAGTGVMRIDLHNDHRTGQVVDMSAVGHQIAVRQAQLAGSDHDVSIRSFLDTDDSHENRHGVLLRLAGPSPLATTGYEVQWLQGPRDVFRLQIHRHDSGTTTLLADSGDLSSLHPIEDADADDTIVLRGTIVGTVITAYLDGTERLSYDTAGDGTRHDTGTYTGVRQHREYAAATSQPFFDQFEAADIVPPSTTLAEATFEAGTAGQPLADEGGWVVQGAGHQYDSIAYGGALAGKFTNAAWGELRYTFATPPSACRLRMYVRRGPQTQTTHPFLVQLSDTGGAYIGDFQLRNESGGCYRLRWGYNTYFEQHTTPAPVEQWQRVDLLYRGPDVADNGWTALIYDPSDDTTVEAVLDVPSFTTPIGHISFGFPSNRDMDYWFDDVLLTDTLDDPGPATGPAFSPLDIPWVHAMWADQPGFTPPADGGNLVSGPDNLGSSGPAAWSLNGTHTWEADMGGLGKPAINYPGSAYMTLAVADQTVRTVVVVGKAGGTTNSDLFDSTSRTLLDTNAGKWRLYAGSTNTPSSADADTDVHLFIATFGASTRSLTVDGATVISQATTPASMGTTIAVGASPLGTPPHEGAEIAFVGVIGRELTAQEQADLWAWYQADYSGVTGPAAPTGVTARGDGDGIIDISWNPVVDATEYRLYLDGALTDSGLTGTTFRKTGLTTGQLYSITLTAVVGGEESSQSSAVSERAAMVYTSVTGNLYTGFNPTPLVDSFQGGQQAVEWGKHCAFYSNSRSAGSHFSWYKNGTTEPLYCYAHEFLDGATIAWRSGDSVLVIEWNLGDDAWRQTLLANPGDQMTVNYADTTVNQGSQGAVTGPFNSTLVEHEGTNGATFEVWMWGFTVPDPPPEPDPVALTTTWRGISSDAANATTYTFSGIDIGTDPSAVAIVWLRALSSLAGTTITVDGNPVTPVHERNVLDTDSATISNYYAVLALNSLTGPVDVVVNAGASALRAAVAVWSVDGTLPTVTAGDEHSVEAPGFVTTEGALLLAGYVGGTSVEFSRSNLDGMTVQRAATLVESPDSVLVAADALADDPTLTYVKNSHTPASWSWQAWATFDNRTASPPSTVQNAYIGGQQAQAMYVGNQAVLRTYLGSTLIFGTPPA